MKIVLDLNKRSEIEVSLANKPNKKPTKIYSHYVVYVYSHGGPYCVGFDSEEVATRLCKELTSKTLDCQVTSGYPYEVMY